MADGPDHSSDASAAPHAGGLELFRIDADHWLIRDHRFPRTDARHVVACVEESDDGMDVVWVSRGVPLPNRYRTAGDIVDDLARWRTSARRDTRPVPIASFPPPTSRDGAN